MNHFSKNNKKYFTAQNLAFFMMKRLAELINTGLLGTQLYTGLKYIL